MDNEEFDPNYIKIEASPNDEEVLVNFEENENECETIVVVCTNEDGNDIKLGDTNESALLTASGIIKNEETSLHLEETSDDPNEKEVDEYIINAVDQYICSKCFAVFPTFTRLGLHCRKYHNKKYRPRNNQQGQVNQLPFKKIKFQIKKKMNVADEVKKEKKQAYWCNKCFIYFKSVHLLNEHRKSELHLSGTKCDSCNKVFKFRYLLKLHEKQHIDSPQRVLTKYECIPCKIEITTFPEIILHYEEVHAGAEKCILCNKLVSRGYKRHLKTHKARIYKCLPCDRIFGNNEELKAHYHTEEHKKMKICQVCNKSFLTPAMMRQHYICRHTDEKRHVCDVCGQRFHLTGSLTRHMSFHNESGKNFLCEHCGKNFQKLSNFKYHVSTHTCKRSPTCHFCGGKFKEELEEHMKTHNIEHEEALFECQTCNREFTSQQDIFEHVYESHDSFWCYRCNAEFENRFRLMHHLKNHVEPNPDGSYDEPVDDNTCPICKKTFKYKSTIRYHMLCHTGEKPYTCELCGKGFRKPYHVKLHMSTHTGVYAYSCEVCGAKHNQPSALRNHMLSHEMSYSCSACDKNFKTNEACMSHIMKFHKVQEDEEEPSIVENKIDPLDVSRHVVSPKKEESKKEKQIASDGNMKKLLQKQCVKDFRCKFCIRIFKSEKACTNHTKRYHPQETADLSDIQMQEYMDPRRVDCKFCERFFKSQRAHDNHLLRAHPQHVEMVYQEEELVDDL